MEDVLGSNCIYSQIIYVEFIVMFFSVTSLIISFYNYELNFSQAHTLEINYDDFYSLANMSTKVFNTVSTVVIMINIYFRYKLQIKFEAYTHNLTHQDTLITSGYIRNIIYEWILVIFHPMIFLDGHILSYEKITNDKTITLIFTHNEFLLSIMMFRFYFIIKFYLTLTYYQTSRSARTCRLYGETNSYFFAVRCIFNKNPFKFVVVMFLSCILFFTLTIRIFERVFMSKERNSGFTEDPQDFNDLENYKNIVWCVIITILTVGYGDFFARTTFGRIYTVIGIISGLLTTALVTVGFFKNLELSSEQNKVFILLERMKIREKHDGLQREMVEMLMSNHNAKFKARKARENLDKNGDIMTDAEKAQALKEIKKWTKVKEKNDIEIKHLIRDKNMANKNLENINTSQYIMESIIDDIVAIISDVDDSCVEISNIIESLSTNFKKDSIIINSIKKKITTDSHIIQNTKFKENEFSKMFKSVLGNINVGKEKSKIIKEIENSGKYEDENENKDEEKNNSFNYLDNNSENREDNQESNQNNENTDKEEEDIDFIPIGQIRKRSSNEKVNVFKSSIFNFNKKNE